jgi:GNAT superfamily N-acetyltransferase
LLIRKIRREEIEKLRNIDRSEIVEQVYNYKNENLIIKDEFYDVPGWSPSDMDSHIEELDAQNDRGDYIFGAFDGEKLIGIAVLGSEFINSTKDQLEVIFLHVDAKYRKQGVGTNLMNRLISQARELEAKKLYVSATPSKNTVDFYLNRGACLTKELNSELFELEPEDIHLDLNI